MPCNTGETSQYAIVREIYVTVSSAFYHWKRCLDEAGFLLGVESVPESDKQKAVKRLEAAYEAFLKTVNKENHEQ